MSFSCAHPLRERRNRGALVGCAGRAGSVAGDGSRILGEAPALRVLISQLESECTPPAA
jgi:hypothetical protein